MIRENIILIGGGGHAKACIDVLHSTNSYNIIGYTDKVKTLEPKFNINYLGTDDCLEKYITTSSFLITIGQIKSPQLRIKIFEKMLNMGAKLPTIISPTAYVSVYAKIGIGTIIMHKAILQANVEVGNNCIINDRSLLEHDVVVGDHCHISTSTTLNGEVQIGDSTFVGSGTIIKNGVHVCKNVIIGMGANVFENILNEGLYLSNYYKKNES